jgi:hypothetical protein
MAMPFPLLIGRSLPLLRLLQEPLPPPVLFRFRFSCCPLSSPRPFRVFSAFRKA